MHVSPASPPDYAFNTLRLFDRWLRILTLPNRSLDTIVYNFGEDSEPKSAGVGSARNVDAALAIAPVVTLSR